MGDVGSLRRRLRDGIVSPSRTDVQRRWRVFPEPGAFNERAQAEGEARRYDGARPAGVSPLPPTLEWCVAAGSPAVRNQISGTAPETTRRLWTRKGSHPLSDQAAILGQWLNESIEAARVLREPGEAC